MAVISDGTLSSVIESLSNRFSAVTSLAYPSLSCVKIRARPPPHRGATSMAPVRKRAMHDSPGLGYTSGATVVGEHHSSARHERLVRL
jgi:hypothetical protein